MRTAQGYSLDAVVVVAGREVAVEVDGPSHFVGRVPTGATRWAFHCQGEGGAHRGAPDPLERGDERRADRVDAQRLRNG